MASAVGTGRAMENGNGDPSTLAVCGCCVCQTLAVLTLPPSLPQLRRKWHRLRGKKWFSCSSSGYPTAGRWGSAQGSFKQSVTAEPARFGTHMNWSHFTIPSLRNLVLVVEMVIVMGERWRWHLSHPSLGSLSASPWAAG